MRSKNIENGLFCGENKVKKSVKDRELNMNTNMKLKRSKDKDINLKID